MYWEKLGSFSYELLYTNMVQKYDNAIFIEIGSWIGVSAIAMAEKIKFSEKNIKFYTIDTFEGDNDHKNESEIINKTLFQTFSKNIEPVKDYINVIVGDSSKVHEKFQNESIDFVFIDGLHTYQGVLNDIKGWLPKLKKGGIMAGHDYNEPTCGVKLAVDSYFLFQAQQYPGGCWIYYKK